MSLRLRYAARSDVGLRRDGNEDSVYAGPRLLAVADGMGGHAAGEVASRVVIASLAPLDDDIPGGNMLDALRDAVLDANSALRDMVAGDDALAGMGTTLTVLLAAGSKLGVAHIGDSRAYLLRDGALTQITRDHTLVQDLIDEGRLSAEEADTHPQRSLIMRALQGQQAIELDLSVREVRAGDRYLVCTDGLSGVVSEETLAETLAEPDPDEAADRLVALALRGGGPDNITCIVADVVEDKPRRLAADTPVVAGAAAGIGGGRPSGDTPAGRAALAEATRRPSQPAPEDDPAELVEVPPQASLAKRVLVVTGLVIVVLGAATVGTWLYLRSQWYVGEDAGTVAIFRGVQTSIAGIPLYSMQERPGPAVAALPPIERDKVADGIPANGLTMAHRIVSHLRDAATTPCPPTVQAAPSPGALLCASATP